MILHNNLTGAKLGTDGQCDGGMEWSCTGIQYCLKPMSWLSAVHKTASSAVALSFPANKTRQFGHEENAHVRQKKINTCYWEKKGGKHEIPTNCGTESDLASKVTTR